MSYTTHDWYLNSNDEYNLYCYYTNMFTSDEIKKIHSLIQPKDLAAGITDLGDAPVLERKSDVFFLPSNENDEFKFIFRRCVDFIQEANEQFFQYDLEKIQTLQYTVYKKGEYYKEHFDMKQITEGKGCRKLSFSVQLSNPNDYQGGDLVLKIGGSSINVPKALGTVIFFPSFLSHEVTQVTEGKRISLVGWVNGPKWK